MGTGSSKNPSVGVQLNPRVQYAGDLAKQEGKDKLIDVPVLVKLEHGTVRYRYQTGGQGALIPREQQLDRRVERPHEGPERSKKHGYFFHATLNDFSEEAHYDKEQDWKFRYVYKGAEASHQKKLYYVFGKGLNTKDQGIMRGPEPKPQGVGYKWPTVFKQHGHIYFDLSFVVQAGELEPDEDDDLDMPDTLENSVDITPKQTILQVSSSDRVEHIRKRLSIRLLKPPGHMHLFLGGTELSTEQVIGDLRSETDGAWKNFRILLRPK